jgi:hypothetical protein
MGEKMGLKEDAKKIIKDTLGEEVSNQVKSFDNPEKYPKDFLDQCSFFLGNLIGQENAKKKFEELYNKYTKK